MNSLKEKTISLRLKGYSYNEINKMLNVPKSTLSGWLSNLPISKEAQERLDNRVREGGVNAFIKRNMEQTMHAQKRAKDTRTKAFSEIKELSMNDLLIIGTVLYWAEGYKRLKVKNGKEITSHVIGLTNSDPDIVFSFILFLKKILLIPAEKIMIEMRLFEHINAEEAILYWMNATGLSRSQFKKPLYPISTASRGMRPKNRLPYGTIQVIVCDTKLFHHVLGLIDGIKQKLKNLPR